MNLSDSEKKRHDQLTTLLIKKIQQAGGSIPFSEYMEAVLYAPELGYYMASDRIFGATESVGDFTTAPEISSLYGQTLAQVCHKILSTFDNKTNTIKSGNIILELGAGTGKLALDILQALENISQQYNDSSHALPDAYWIVDPSPVLRKKQQTLLEKNLPHWNDKIQWFDSLETLQNFSKKPFNGIIIANEVLDAMPAQRFRVTKDQCFETYVQYNNHNDNRDNNSNEIHNSAFFQDYFVPSDNSTLLELAEKIRNNGAFSTLSPNETYDSEWIPALPSFFQSLFNCLNTGAVLFMDYGFPEHEFYHPDRFMGTLMCHYRQQAHIDPYLYVGLQDITTHIDFTHVAECATQAGFSLGGYTQQAAFLMNAGLLNLIASTISDTERKLNTRDIQLLTSPAEMGELFKVMALTKNSDLYPFPGFELFDKRHTL